MTRNLMIGFSLLTLTSATAIAAPAAAVHHHAKANVVAEAPAGDTAAPATDKPAKKAAKKGGKKTKGDATKSEMKGDAPSGAKAPTPETAKTK